MKLVKIGAMAVWHGRYVPFPLAKAPMPRKSVPVNLESDRWCRAKTAQAYASGIEGKARMTVAARLNGGKQQQIGFNHRKIVKSGLSDGRNSKFLPLVVKFYYTSIGGGPFPKFGPI